MPHYTVVLESPGGFSRKEDWGTVRPPNEILIPELPNFASYFGPDESIPLSPCFTHRRFRYHREYRQYFNSDPCLRPEYEAAEIAVHYTEVVSDRYSRQTVKYRGAHGALQSLTVPANVGIGELKGAVDSAQHAELQKLCPPQQENQ